MICLAILITVWTSYGCNLGSHSVPIKNIYPKDLDPSRLGRIDIPPEDLALGLNRAFQRLSTQLGVIDYQPIVQDYVPLIRTSLYKSGFCGIRRLNLNGATVDMDISFLIDQTPAALRIDVFIDGNTQPAFSLVNRYNIITQ